MLISVRFCVENKYTWCKYALSYFLRLKSKYPTFLYENEIKSIPAEFSESSYIGYSDHCVGIAPALRSYLSGAKYLEKHFTSDVFSQNVNEKAHLCSFTRESLREFKTIIRQFDIIDYKA